MRPENRSVGEGLKGAGGITNNFQLEKYKLGHMIMTT